MPVCSQADEQAATRGGECLTLPGNVVARPVVGGLPSPPGAITDPNGTAWLVFQEAGEYEIICGSARTSFHADWLDTYAQPGYQDVPRLSLKL